MLWSVRTPFRKFKGCHSERSEESEKTDRIATSVAGTNQAGTSTSRSHLDHLGQDSMARSLAPQARAQDDNHQGYRMGQGTARPSSSRRPPAGQIVDSVNYLTLPYYVLLVSRRTPCQKLLLRAASMPYATSIVSTRGK